MHDDIGVHGHLDGNWSAWFDGLQASCDDRAETTITGRVADLAILHGLPAKVRDWALSCSRGAAPTRPTTQMEQRDAAGTKPKARGGNAAAPAALGRQATAAAPTAKPDRPAQPVRPAPALLTPPRHETDNMPDRPHPITTQQSAGVRVAVRGVTRLNSRPDTCGNLLNLHQD